MLETHLKAHLDVTDIKPKPLLERIINQLTPTRLSIAVFIFALAVLCQLQFWKLPSVKDRANWDYFAQVVSRGGSPYKDVVNIKTPLSAYIGAVSILATKPLGLSPVLATRFMFVGLCAMTIVFVFLVGSMYAGSRRAGALAAVILSGIFMFGRLSSDGIQPKTPMILFGLISLWAAMKDRPYTAGVFGMLSALSWQPGLLFVGAGGLAFTRYLTSWRDLKVIRVLAGAAIPLGIFLTHLWLAGSLSHFWLWCLKYNVTVYAPHDFTTYTNFATNFRNILEKFFSEDRKYFWLAGLGIGFAVFDEVYRGIRQGWLVFLDRSPQQQLIIAPIVYLIFCRINMQGEQDLIPLLPFVAIFAAIVLVELLDLIVPVLGKLVSIMDRQTLRAVSYGAVVLIVFYVSVRPDFAFHVGRKNLQEQRSDAADLLSHLQPGEQIWVHGRTELLVLWEMTNSHKYTNLDHGKDNYLDEVEAGGFQAWFEQLKADRPQIVVFDRAAIVHRKADILEWLRSEYTLQRGRTFFKYYLRKD